MATEGFDRSGVSSDVESSNDDNLVEEELTFMEGEVESRERVLVRKSVRFTNLLYQLHCMKYAGVVDPHL